MKHISTIHDIDLRFQVDHNNPEETQFFEENLVATKDARLFSTFFRHKKNKVVSDGEKFTEVTII